MHYVPDLKKKISSRSSETEIVCAFYIFIVRDEVGQFPRYHFEIALSAM